MTGPAALAVTVTVLAAYAALYGICSAAKAADRTASQAGWPGHSGAQPPTRQVSASLPAHQQMAWAEQVAATINDDSDTPTIDAYQLLDALATTGLCLTADTRSVAASAFYQAAMDA